MRHNVIGARRAGSGTTALAVLALIGIVLSTPTLSKGQTITVCRPNGAESLTVGDRHAIHWNWSGSISSVKIEYSTDEGSSWNVIAASTTNDGSYLWSAVPNAPSESCRVKVTSVAAPGISDMSDADFTIARPVITVTRPNGGPGGESWTVGEKHVIHWDWTGDFSSVKLEYTSDGGSTWNVISASTTNDGYYQWTVPNAPATTCRVKVTSTADQNCFDVSDADFSILRPAITVVRPNGGETYYAGKYAPIHWDWSGDFSAAKLEYSTDGGSSWTVIAPSVTNDGGYAWHVPGGISSTTCRVRTTNTADANSYDVSDGNFTVRDSLPADSLYLFSPRTSDAWLVGRSYYIDWTWSGSISAVKLEYSTDGGSTWGLITASTANDGEYAWPVPSTPSTSGKIKISSTANPSTYDESDVFTIEKQWIRTTSPRTGDAWLVGRSYYITWDWGGDFTTAKLEYSTDGGSTWSLITASTANDGEYAWGVSDPPGTNCVIKITNADNPEAFDQSDVFVAAPQAITVTSPLTGDEWYAARNYYVTWYWTGAFASAKVEYSTDGGATWGLVVASIANDGEYEWLVPNTPSPNCKARVTNIANTAANGVSGVFTILPAIGVAEHDNGLRSVSLWVGPNPGRRQTTLRYSLARESDVDVTILDAAGRLVANLAHQREKPGDHELHFSARSAGKGSLQSGIYFGRLKCEDSVQLCKFLITE